MPIDFTPNPHDPDRWLRCARCGTPVREIDARAIRGALGDVDGWEIRVACHDASEIELVRAMDVRSFMLRNPLRIPARWRQGQAFGGAPVSSSLSAACTAILEDIIRATVVKYEGSPLSPELLQAMGEDATRAARDRANEQPAIALARITYQLTPGVAGSVGAYVDLSPPNRSGVRISPTAIRDFRRDAIGEWRDHPADAAMYTWRGMKEEERRSTARRNAMTPEQWGHSRDAAGFCVACKADRTMWCDAVVHERIRALGSDLRPMTYAELAEPPLTEEARKRRGDDSWHVLEWAMHNIECRAAVGRLLKIFPIIEAVRAAEWRKHVGPALLLAILRVVSRAWASSPTLLELDLEPINPHREAKSLVACDDAELRFALLDIDPTQKG